MAISDVSFRDVALRREMASIDKQNVIVVFRKIELFISIEEKL